MIFSWMKMLGYFISIYDIGTLKIKYDVDIKCFLTS